MGPSQNKRAHAPPTMHTSIHQGQSESTQVHLESPRSACVTQQTTPPNDSNMPKRSRGVARGFEVKKRLKTGGKIQGVIFNEGKWLPVGPAEKIFKMELGVITRLLSPLHVFYWKHMTPAQKTPLFERLEGKTEALKNQQTHEGNNNLTDDQIREEVLGSKIGYARGLGHGVKPCTSNSSRASVRFQAQQAEEAERQAEEAERQAQQCHEEVQTQQSKITNLEDSQLNLQQAIQTLAARFDARSI